MNQTNNDSPQSNPLTRRDFLRNSSLAAAGAAAAASFPAVLRAQDAQPINAVILGVGGRGSGAGGNLMEAAKTIGANVKIVATADIFADAARNGKQFGVPEDKCFSGFDAYIKALSVPGVNYAILAAPPGFRPPHFKACIEMGKNVFMEKPVAVDGPGARIMYAAYEEAKKKNLKVAAGTQRRHQAGYIDTIKKIQDGAIGDIVSLRAYWVNGGPIWHRGERPGKSALEQQIANWYHYIWLSGDHICEQHVHNIDVCNWIMNDHPKKCWGMGARQQLGNKSGEIWDNYAAEFEYAKGARMFSYCGQIKRSWASVSEFVHGTKGSANPGGEIYPKDGQRIRASLKLDHGDAYVQEHIDLIRAIQKDLPLNEAKNVTDSTLTAIMGREAAFSGSEVDWDMILNSKFEYGPAQLYKDASKMQWGDFRTLKAPMPGSHNIFSDPPAVAGA